MKLILEYGNKFDKYIEFDTGEKLTINKECIKYLSKIIETQYISERR